MDSRIHQLIAADRLQQDIRAAAAAREAKAVAAQRRGWFRDRPTVAPTRRFVRRSESTTISER
jgi:hypothetical protein